MICCVRSAIFIASSVGIANASSMPFVCRHCAPPSTAASACRPVRTMLTLYCGLVSDAAAVWQWKRSRIESGFGAPKRSFMIFA